MKKFVYTNLWALAFTVSAPLHAQQLVCERLLTAPGLQVRFPTACVAPNGEFVLTGAAQPQGSTAGTTTHAFVARLTASGCDTLWQRTLPHRAYYYTASAVRADARGLWLLTPDSLGVPATAPPPWPGVRLWRLSPAGRVRRVVRPPARTVREALVDVLPAPDGDVYVQVANQNPAGGFATAGLLRLDNLGGLRWRHDYGYAGGNNGAGLCFAPTGRVLLASSIGVNAAYESHVRVLEADPARGDSLGGTALPFGPGVRYETMLRANTLPLALLPLTRGGYAVAAVASDAAGQESGQLTRLDAACAVQWRYRLPNTATESENRRFAQVQELADGTLLALVRPRVGQRAYWLYRFDGATRGLLAVYPFTSAYTALEITVANLLPVRGDSTLLVVGGTRLPTGQAQGVYVAKVRIPGLPRVVTGLTAAVRSDAPLALFPNPATGVVAVTRPAGAGPGVLELRDGLGRLVRQVAVDGAGPPVLWSLAGVAPGVYTVYERGSGARRVSRLVVE